MLPRAFARIIGAVLLIVLALAGLALAAFCFDGVIRLGSARPDRLLKLPTVRRHVGHFLAQLAAPGHTAGLALICGVGAVIIGVVLLIGVLRGSPERLVVLERDADDGGMLAARSSTLRVMARALAEQASGATSVGRPKVRLSRRGTRGRLKVSAAQARTSERQEVQQAVQHQLEPISRPFNLKPRVRIHVGERGERVQ